jgi:hypothetical protein
MPASERALQLSRSGGSMFNLGYYRGGLLPAVYAGRPSLKEKFDRVFKAAS